MPGTDESLLSLQHDGKPYCNQPCYAALFGPKGRSLRDWCFQQGGMGYWILAHVYLPGLLPRSMITRSSTQSYARTPWHLATAAPAWTPRSPCAPCLSGFPHILLNMGTHANIWGHMQSPKYTFIHYTLHLTSPFQCTRISQPYIRLQAVTLRHPLTPPFPFSRDHATFPSPLSKVTWIMQGRQCLKLESWPLEQKLCLTDSCH